MSEPRTETFRIMFATIEQGMQSPFECCSGGLQLCSVAFLLANWVFDSCPSSHLELQTQPLLLIR